MLAFFRLIVLLLLVAHGFAGRSVAQTSRRLVLSASAVGRSVFLEHDSSQSVAGCRLTTYGAVDGSALKADFRRAGKVAELRPTLGRVVIRAGIPILRTTSRRVRSVPLSFRSALRCARAMTLSNVVRIRVPTSTGRESKRFGEWATAVKRSTRLLESRLIPVAPALQFAQPVDIQRAPGDERTFVVEQAGRIYAIDSRNSSGARELFLDIVDRVESGGEQGLLGLAFSPHFEHDRTLFAHYSKKDTGATVIARFTALSDGSVAPPETEFVVLEIPQPAVNHNGGSIAFGADGMLYIGLGDGGGGGDPFENAENLSSPLGKILRIDVSRQDPGLGYGIPSDNPFVGLSNGERGEIFAYGLRNPWRMSFDSATGNLWVGDVGQNRFEEVNIVSRGGNFGWDVLEGFECYEPSSGCSSAGTVLPVHAYSHALGNSITGGYVYRGDRNRLLKGQYLFADFISGRIWSLRAVTPTWPSSLLHKTDDMYSTFGLDPDGEVLVASYVDGRIYRLGTREQRIP